MLRKAFDDLGRAKKQLDLLMSYINLSKFLQPTKRIEVTKKELLEKSGASAAILNGLIEKNIFEIYKKEISRLVIAQTDTQAIYPLNSSQQTALQEIIC